MDEEEIERAKQDSIEMREKVEKAFPWVSVTILVTVVIVFYIIWKVWQ